MFEPWRNVANFFSSGYIPAAPAIWSDKGRVETNGGMHGIYRRYGEHSGVYRINSIANASNAWRNRVYLQEKGGILFDKPGTYYWTVPSGIGNIDAVVIAGGGGGAGNTYGVDDDGNLGPGAGPGGGGGGGGGLMWRNSLSASAGDILTVVVGAGGRGGTTLNTIPPADGGDSYIQTSGGTDLVKATGGQAGLYNELINNAAGGQSQHLSIGFGGGGNGGQGGKSGINTAGGGGGGTAGYSGNGGAGANTSGYSSGAAANSGGGGGSSGINPQSSGIIKQSLCGGGVAPYGIGATGANVRYNPIGNFGKDGSSGTLGVYGAGGAGCEDDFRTEASDGRPGVVRIVFAPNATDREFPGTNVDIQYSGLNEITY